MHRIIFVAVGGALIFPSWSFLDRVGAVIVSIFILHAAVKIIWPGISELIDVGAPQEIQANIQACALKSKGGFEAHAIRTLYISKSIQVDLHIVVDGSMTVREGHAIADDVRDCIIGDITDVVDVVVHVDPPESTLNAPTANEIGD